MYITKYYVTRSNLPERNPGHVGTMVIPGKVVRRQNTSQKLEERGIQLQHWEKEQQANANIE
jgi:hypothetical protein